MRYPEFLKENGTIGYVAPSFGCNMEPYYSAFQNALSKLEALGYQAKLGPNVYAGEGIGISNTPYQCGKELTEFYCSQENELLISCGGGEMMCEILGEVDFEKIRQSNPKWYMGFSDNTNMTFLLTTICDVASVYGPCAAAFGMEPWHASLSDALGILTGKQNKVSGYDLWEKEGKKDEEHPFEPYNVTEKRVIKSILPSGFTQRPDVALVPMKEATGETIQMKGRLIGGCMDCLVNFLGTEFDHVSEFVEKYKEDGMIWFLEACDLNVMGIRRAIWQMEHAGWFQYVKGFLIGRPLHFGEDMMGLDQYHAVYDILATKNVPMIMDIDLGHLSPMMPMVCGAIGEITVSGNDIDITYLYE